MIGEPIFCMDLERPWIHLDQRISCLVGWKGTKICKIIQVSFGSNFYWISSLDQKEGMTG